MQWYHECDLAWLKARQEFLTATDVKELLPFTKTGRKRAVDNENYLKILAGKMRKLTENDCISTGAAARGHMLEPYAIGLFNDSVSFHHLHHWDDLVISRPGQPSGGLAFSPDAMDCPMPLASGAVIEADCFTDDIRIGEVKAYSPERHMIAGYTPKEELEERWQIATAMAVCEKIKVAYLLFYNPSMANQLYVVEYDRNDLASEIDTVLGIEQDWLAWLDIVDPLGSSGIGLVVVASPDNEEKIMETIEATNRLNPGGA
jgi:hypothetical protein